jgi:fumarate hydratase subunit beta
MIRINTPLDKIDIGKLKIGDKVLLSGIIYTARDQAHKRLIEAIKQHRKLPISLKG